MRTIKLFQKFTQKVSSFSKTSPRGLGLKSHNKVLLVKDGNNTFALVLGAQRFPMDSMFMKMFVIDLETDISDVSKINS